MQRTVQVTRSELHTRQASHARGARPLRRAGLGEGGGGDRTTSPPKGRRPSTCARLQHTGLPVRARPDQRCRYESRLCLPGRTLCAWHLPGGTLLCLPPPLTAWERGHPRRPPLQTPRGQPQIAPEGSCRLMEGSGEKVWDGVSSPLFPGLQAASHPHSGADASATVLDTLTHCLFPAFWHSARVGKTRPSWPRSAGCIPRGSPSATAQSVPESLQLQRLQMRGGWGDTWPCREASPTPGSPCTGATPWQSRKARDVIGVRDAEAGCESEDPQPLASAPPSSSFSKQQAFLSPSELLRNAHVFQSWEKEIRGTKIAGRCSCCNAKTTVGGTSLDPAVAQPHGGPPETPPSPAAAPAHQDLGEACWEEPDVRLQGASRRQGHIQPQPELGLVAAV